MAKRRSSPPPLPGPNDPPRRGSAHPLVSAEWRDPADDRPSAARSPRMVRGYRSFDPIRRMAAGNDSVTAAHIHAADYVREIADLTRLGYAAGGERYVWLPMNVQPRSGPGAGELARAAAARNWARLMRALDPLKQMLLVCVILNNRSVRYWTMGLEATSGVPCSQQREKQRLLSLLDFLAEFYGTEIETGLASGRRLPV